MTPCQHHFEVGFALGEKAVRAARQSDLPETLLTLIEGSPKYAEGRGVRLIINNMDDVRSVVKIAEIKMVP